MAVSTRLGIMHEKNTIGKVLVVIAAFLSFLFSVGLRFSGQREKGVFVGVWVPSILSFGCLMLVGQGGEP